MSRRLIAICLLVLIVGGGLIAVTAGLFANDPAEVRLTDRTSWSGPVADHGTVEMQLLLSKL